MMLRQGLLESCVVLFLYIWVCNGFAYSQVKETLDEAKKNYSANIRPLLNQSESVYVTMSMYLMRITAVKESEQTLQTTGFFVITWIDQIMKQALEPLCVASEKCKNISPREGVGFFDNFDVNYVHMSPDNLWLPDIRIHNAQRKFSFNMDEALLSLYYTGFVVWVPGGQMETLCDMDVRKFPFDRHTCHFDIGPWQTDKINLVSDSNNAYLMYYENDGEWQITNSYVSKNVSYIIGGCCRFTIDIRRRPEMLVATMILPTTLLSLIGTLAFKLPTESGERISLSVSVTLALILYLTIIQNILPRSVVKPSYFEILLCTQVLFNLINLFMTFVNIYIYYKCGTFKLKRNSVFAKLIPQRYKKIAVTQGLRETVDTQTMKVVKLEEGSRVHVGTRNGTMTETNEALPDNHKIITDDFICVSSAGVSNLADNVALIVADLANLIVLTVFVVVMVV